MSLHLLVSIADEGPWCGTRPPGSHVRPPRPPHGGLGTDFQRVAALGPRPEPWFTGPGVPWRVGTVEVGLYGAISLVQTGRLVTGIAAEGFASAASFLFDDTCGSIPLADLIWLLLHQPPPPPPQWLNELIFAGQALAFAQATQQEEVAMAATRRIGERLKAFGLDAERSRAAD